MLIQSGYSFANTIQAIDLEVADMKNCDIGRDDLSEQSVQRGSLVLDTCDALAGVWELVLAGEPLSLRAQARGTQQLDSL